MITDLVEYKENDLINDLQNKKKISSKIKILNLYESEFPKDFNSELLINNRAINDNLISDRFTINSLFKGNQFNEKI